MQEVKINTLKLYQSTEGSGFYSICQWVSIFKQGQYKDQYQRNIINRVLQLKNANKWGEFWTEVIEAVKNYFEADIIVVIPGSSGEFSHLQDLLDSHHLKFKTPQLSRKYQTSKKTADITYPPEVIQMNDLNGLAAQKVILLDDVITTGATMRFWRSYLQGYGIDPICLALGMAEKIPSEVVHEITLEEDRPSGMVNLPKNGQKKQEMADFIPKSDKTEHRQAAMLAALRASLGNVKAACEATGIGRSTFYTWKEEDPEFAKKLAEMKEDALDFVEGKMMERIRAGSDVLIQFYLKTQGKERGYVERTETKNVDPITAVEVTIVPPRTQVNG